MKIELKRLRILILCVFCVFVYANQVSAVIYEFVENWSGEVLGEMNISSPPASATSSWSYNGALSSILEGGISGLSWDFGIGLEQAQSGDFKFSHQALSSLSGSYLDSGFNDFGGAVYFKSGYFYLDELSMSAYSGRDYVGVSL